MKHFITTKSSVLFILTLCISLLSQAQTFNSSFVDGQIYLKFKDSEPITFTVNDDNKVSINSIPFIQQLASEYQLVGLSRPYFLNNDPKLLRTLLLEISEFEKINQVINKLQLQDAIEYVEKVPLDQLVYVPNDSLYNMYNGPSNWNWHLDLINAEQAWDITLGSPNINVAVVDNAVWVDHPDLVGKIVAQRDIYYNTASANPPATGDPGEWSHGTHVAGLVGATSDNNIGISAIGFNVNIIAVKASNNNSPRQISAGYPGIQWAANNGADVINMSWGGSGFSQTNLNVINSIHNMGILLIAAAGNDNVSTPHYPSAYPNVISVASVDWNDVKSDFSNFSTTVDLSAPGGSASPGPSGLLSTTFSAGTYGNYDSFEGTSMAAPVVAGLAGLVLSVNPDLTPDEVRFILESTSDDITALNPDHTGMLGLGRINAFKAVSSTPFQPTANFQTTVEEIVPGTSIDFFDLSTGIPSDWEWTFEGATPSFSNDTNPENILYHTAGTYDVTLTVTNQFGTSSVTYFDYIQVVTDPIPYIFVTVSNTEPCIAEVVTLTDSSLYGPTSWEWVINPNSYTYVNGTSASSQNPEVEFLSQGPYQITLTAWNLNGMKSKLFDDLIHVQGVTPPYILDMEDGTTEYFVLWDTIKSQSAVDLRAANNSTRGIHFHGDPVPVGWKGSPTEGTASQAWLENLAFHGYANLCGVDARQYTNVKLSLDLRQTFSLGPKYSWFRVLINGTPVPDFEGNVNFNPTTAGEDPWRRLEFDLSSFAGSVFDVSLQASTRFSDKIQGEGDNVFIDNIEITNSVSTNPSTYNSAGLHIYPNPTKGALNVEISGMEGQVTLEVVNMHGLIVYKNIMHNPKEQGKVQIPSLSPGLYIVRAINKDKQFYAKLIVSEKL